MTSEFWIGVYYSLCHGLVLAGILFSFLPKFADGSSRARALNFRGLLISMGITTAGMTYNFFQSLTVELDNRIILVIKILSLISLAGLCGTITFVPRFIGSFSDFKHAPVVSRKIVFFTAGLLPFQVFMIMDPSSRVIIIIQNAVSIIDTLALSGSIIWSGVIGISAIRSGRIDESKLSFPWLRLLKTMLTAGIILTPFIIVNDLLLLPEHLHGKTYPTLLPVLATIWSIAFIYLGLKALTSHLNDSQSPSFAPEAATWETSSLTPRETEIARLVVSGYSYKMIAELLGISLSTVKTHILKVYDKTGAGNKIELLNFSD